MAPAAMIRLAATVLVLLMLAAESLLVGVGDLRWSALFGPEGSGAATLLFASRIPRTLALLIAGAAIAVAGMVMQMLLRNRFVEPSTAGTVEAASLGMLVANLAAPGAPVFAKMLVSAGFALAGTALFLALLKRIPLRSAVMVPLIGLMLGSVLGALATFIAYRFDLLQSLNAWTTGDFSTVLRGRYELLWIGATLAAAVYVTADRFTVAGLGRDHATNLGLDYRRVLWAGLGIVALVTASVVATVGVIPFLGLVVPNLVSLAMGDNMRRSLPYVALSGAGFLLACDIAGRLLNYPYEIPVGAVMGVVGSALFLFLLLRRSAHAG